MRAETGHLAKENRQAEGRKKEVSSEHDRWPQPRAALKASFVLQQALANHHNHSEESRIVKKKLTGMQLRLRNDMEGKRCP